MLGYGRDESVPYAWRNVCTPFRGCSPHFRKPSAAKWQSVSSRRGRFIAPAYTYTPTKWQTEMRIRWNEYTYSIMWKHVIDNVDMCVRWNGNTYLMTWIYVFDYVRIRARWIGPLRLAECSQPISWVSVGISRNVCWYLVERFTTNRRIP